MDTKEMQALKRGDIVQGASGRSYVIVELTAAGPVAVRSVTITNPDEWTLVKPQAAGS